MPRRAKGPRLYLHPRERVWLIRDGPVTRRTGCSEGDRSGAEKALGDYIGEKFKPVARQSDLALVPVAEVLTAYGTEHAPNTASAETIGYCIDALADWWGTRTLADVHKVTCQGYITHRRASVGDSKIRRELGVLGTAINHWHAAHGPLTAVPIVTLPEKPPARDRWLTRSEAAQLLAGALGFYRVFSCDVASRREAVRWERYRPGINRHLARFILLGLYSGSRKSAILSIRWLPGIVGGWIDLERSILFRKGREEVESKKRRPRARLGRRIIAHARRWRRLDDAARAEAVADAGTPEKADLARSLYLHVVSWRGKPMAGVRTSWDAAIELAWLAPEFTGEGKVTPHVLRHTRATWLAQAKVDRWEAAGHIGASPRTLDEVYQHHHPDFQKQAAEV